MIRFLSAVLATLLISQSALAVVTAPNVWYDFNNSDNQSAQAYGHPDRFDGLFKDNMGTGIDLYLWERNNSPADYAYFSNGWTATNRCQGYANGCSAPAGQQTPIEDYVAAPTSGLGNNLGMASHWSGGTHRIYADDDGTPGIDAQTDSIGATGVYEYNFKSVANAGTSSWLTDSYQHAELNSSGGANGGMLTYSFWLNVQLATSGQDQSGRFNTSSSFIIGRGSGWSNGGYGGEVSIKDGGGAGLDYKLQFRNDGGPSGIQQTSAVFDNGVWHHFSIGYDMTGAEGVVTVWIDGGPLAGGSKEVLTGFGNNAISDDFIVNNVAHPNAPFKETGDFYLDDLAVWSGYILTDAEAAEIYNLGLAQSLVPEPSSFALAGLGLVALGWFGWRKRRS